MDNKNIIETWKQLYNYETYQISNTGKVKSIDRIVTDKNGIDSFRRGNDLTLRSNKIEPHLFFEIQLNIDGVRKRKTIYIHKAVAEHFIDKPEINTDKYIFVAHKNNDYTDNSVNNLMYITHKQLMNRQPNRISNPTKAWKTRKEKYGYSGYLRANKVADLKQ